MLLGNHDGHAISVAFTPDSTRLASTGADEMVRLWDVRRRVALGVLKGHEGSVAAVAFSSDGRLVASGGFDNTIRLWSVERREAIGAPLEGHIVTSLAFSPDGRRLVSGGQDGTLRLWDVISRTQILVIEGAYAGRQVNRVVFDTDGKLLLAASTDGKLRIWNAETGTMVGTPMEGRTFAVTPNGRRIVSVSDNKLSLWNLRRGKAQSVTDRYTPLVDDIVWIASNVVVTSGDDRLTFRDLDFTPLGEVILHAEGLVAIVPERGVYASRGELRSGVTAFSGARNQGPAEAIEADAVREVLFGEWDLSSYTCDVLARSIRVINKWRDHFGIPLWVMLLFGWWLLGAVAALAMWACLPWLLAEWAISRGDRERPANQLVWLQHFMVAVWPFIWLGGKRRPLRQWVRRHRSVLEDTCFCGRSSVGRHERYCSVGHERAMEKFTESIRNKGRGRLWVTGVGGSGKTALAIHLLRDTMVGDADAPLPIFVGEDWGDSLAAQVARQMRHPRLQKVPTVAMVKVLGRSGALCPLVDSLSERRSGNPVKDVKDAIEEEHFRHVVVTSKRSYPGDQALRGVATIKTRPLQEGDVGTFVDEYADERERPRVRAAIERLCRGSNIPSPLFLCIAIRQAGVGGLESIDPGPLVVRYVDDLRKGATIGLDRGTMLRVAAVAAIVAIQSTLSAQSFLRHVLEAALAAESNRAPFCNVSGEPLRPTALVGMLVDAGLVEEGPIALQFSYDPVAEYLAALWVGADNANRLARLQKRVVEDGESGVGRAYAEMKSQEAMLSGLQ